MNSRVPPPPVESESHPLWWRHTLPFQEDERVLLAAAAHYNHYQYPPPLRRGKILSSSESESLPVWADRKPANSPPQPQPQPPPHVSILRRILDKCNPFDAPLHLLFVPFMILWAIIHLAGLYLTILVSAVYFFSYHTGNHPVAQGRTKVEEN